MPLWSMFPSNTPNKFQSWDLGTSYCLLRQLLSQHFSCLCSKPNLSGETPPLLTPSVAPVSYTLALAFFCTLMFMSFQLQGVCYFMPASQGPGSLWFPKSSGLLYSIPAPSVYNNNGNIITAAKLYVDVNECECECECVCVCVCVYMDSVPCSQWAH
jgi:hypothetical protein